MKKAILFDFGGTLDTDGIHWSEKFLEAYHHFNISVSRELFKEAFVYSERKMVDIIQPHFNLRSTFNEQIKYQLEFLKDKIELNTELKSVVENISNYCYKSVTENVKISRMILEQLVDKFSLGLISNYYGNVAVVLEELSLKKYFTSIVDSAVVGIRKPDPKIFKIALDELGVNPDDAVMIGDSYNNDIVPAKSIGCKTIWINNKGWNEQNENNKADFIIKSFKELPDILKNKK